MKLFKSIQPSDANLVWGITKKFSFLDLYFETIVLSSTTKVSNSLIEIYGEKVG